MSFMDKLKHKADELGITEKAEHLADEAKKAAAQAKEKAGDLAAENRDRVESALDKATAKIDEKTEGKYSDKLAKAKTQVTKGVDKIAEGGTHPGTAAPAGAAGLDVPLADEEETAEDAAHTDIDPEAPLDSPAPGSGTPRPQRLYDESGEPIDELENDLEAPDRGA